MPRHGPFALVPCLVVLCLALGLGGCGSSPPAPAGPVVNLRLSAPSDGSRTSSASVAVSGVVHPVRAQVRVLGRTVPVSARGAFSTLVALSVGTNLIDVEAALPRSAGSVTAVRVVRFLLVTVPQVSGQSAAQAASGLRGLGLAVKVQANSNPLGFLFPTSVQVCSSSPGAGRRVDPGTTVTLLTSNLCGL